MKLYLAEYEIQAILKHISKLINEDYKGINEPLLVIGLLKGSVIFLSDLIRKLEIPIILDFMMVSSYNNENQQEKEIKIILDLNTSIAGKDVLVVEDIIDTGKTFYKVLELLKSRNPKSLKTCALLDKKECREVEVQLDYRGIVIPNKFVYGYGLDNAQMDRHLPYIATPE